MSDGIFSLARLKGYRILENAGIGASAVELQIINTLIAGRLWLPYSLIEIAFRNRVDAAVSANHPAGKGWLVPAGVDGVSFPALEVKCAAVFEAPREDDSIHDPIREAAIMAAKAVGREEITRDDVIAHLMFGFWVNRCDSALREDRGINIYELVAPEFAPPFDDPHHLRKIMKFRILGTRNRVAHHEPLLFKKKHLFLEGAERPTADLIGAVLDGALPTFRKEVAVAVAAATAMVPPAAAQVGVVPDEIDLLLAPLEDNLRQARDKLRAVREERMRSQRERKGLA